MASTKLAKSNSAPARRGPSPMIAKLKDQLQARGRTISKLRSEGGGMRAVDKVVSFGGAALLGVGETKALVPPRIVSLDSALVIGGIGAFGAPYLFKGKTARLVDSVFLGPLCVAGYRVGLGQPVMAGTRDGELAGGGWGPAE